LPMNSHFRFLARVLAGCSAPLAAVLAVACAPLAASAGPWNLAPGEHYSSVGGSMFSADTYYDLNGFRQQLEGGGHHAEYSAFSYNEFGWTKSRSFILGFPFTSVSRTPGGTNSSSHTTATGFGDLLVGLRFKIKGGAAPVSVELDWNPPMGYATETLPKIGYGASNSVAKLETGGPIGHVGFFEAEGGYRYYMAKGKDANGNRENLHAPTDQILAAGRLAFWLSHTVLLAGVYEGGFGKSSSISPSGTDGFNPLEGDAPGSLVDERVITQLAGPQLLFRLDDRLDVMAGSMHTMSAKSALHVDRFYVAVAVKQTKLNRLQGLLGGSGKP
jgi:hypothetical protein